MDIPSCRASSWASPPVPAVNRMSHRTAPAPHPMLRSAGAQALQRITTRWRAQLCCAHRQIEVSIDCALPDDEHCVFDAISLILCCTHAEPRPGERAGSDTAEGRDSRSHLLPTWQERAGSGAERLFHANVVTLKTLPGQQPNPGWQCSENLAENIMGRCGGLA